MSLWTIGLLTGFALLVSGSVALAQDTTAIDTNSLGYPHGIKLGYAF